MAGTWQVHVDAGTNSRTFTTGANPRLAMFSPAGALHWLDDNGVVVSV